MFWFNVILISNTESAPPYQHTDCLNSGHLPFNADAMVAKKQLQVMPQKLKAQSGKARVRNGLYAGCTAVRSRDKLQGLYAKVRLG